MRVFDHRFHWEDSYTLEYCQSLDLQTRKLEEDSKHPTTNGTEGHELINNLRVFSYFTTDLADIQLLTSMDSSGVG